MSRTQFLGLVFLVALASFSGFHLDIFSQEQRDMPENIVYISIDALSAEHLQCYGYSRETAPNICGLRNATMYENAYTTSSWTPIALGSMQRGAYSYKAGLVDEKTSLDDEYKSIADIANRKSYKTVLKSNHVNVNRKINLDKGFDEIKLHATPKEMKNFSDEFGRDIEGDRTYFRMHLIGSHDPYLPSQNHFNYSDYRYVENLNLTISMLPRRQKSAIENNESYNMTSSERRKVINHYDENIRAVDNYVGQFIEELKNNEEYEESLIVITADHGESFNEYEDDVWLHMEPNPSVARVPLLVKYPNSSESKESKKLVSNIDPYKIILNELGEKVDYNLDAIDPRYEEREKHFSYVKGVKYAVFNESHLLRTDGENYWSYKKDNTDFTRIDTRIESLKDSLISFKEKVEKREYEEAADFTQDERIKEGLEKLGYIG